MATARRTTKTKPIKREIAAEQRPRVLSFLLGGSPILGATVKVSLSPKRTVLVGRNGAGKSAIFEALIAAVHAAVTGVSVVARTTSAPTHFRCDFALGDETLAYEFTWTANNQANPSDPLSRSFEWTERCWSPATKKVAWSVKGGAAHRGDEPTPILLPPGVGVLTLSNVDAWSHAARALRDLFLSVQRVSAGVPRTDGRNFVYGTRKVGAGHWSVPQGGGGRLQDTTAALLNWAVGEAEVFREFNAVGRRLKLWSNVATHQGKLTTDEEFGIILVDGEQLGVLSDGTVRIVELLRYVLSPMPRLLLIEEPETALHPGLAEALLAELDSYSLDHQWMASTHSPLVVAKARAEDIRLVVRDDGKTAVHNLSAGQVARVAAFLSDEGTLGDFVFGGGADD